MKTGCFGANSIKFNVSQFRGNYDTMQNSEAKLILSIFRLGEQERASIYHPGYAVADRYQAIPLDAAAVIH